jgi:hypothetical protein
MFSTRALFDGCCPVETNELEVVGELVVGRDVVVGEGVVEGEGVVGAGDVDAEELDSEVKTLKEYLPTEANGSKPRPAYTHQYHMPLITLCPTAAVFWTPFGVVRITLGDPDTSRPERHMPWRESSST